MVVQLQRKAGIGNSTVTNVSHKQWSFNFKLRISFDRRKKLKQHTVLARAASGVDHTKTVPEMDAKYSLLTESPIPTTKILAPRFWRLRASGTVEATSS